MEFEPSAPPNSARSSNPRTNRRADMRRYPQSAHTPKRSLEPDQNSTFLAQIDTFLSRELAAAHSDSDRIYVYQRAFDLLAQEFQLCRPLLERIKQQYDEMGRSLLIRKRVTMTDASSVSAAEDSLSEQVNRMRRARIQEFSKRRQETEALLDEMTALRVQRSELQQQVGQLDQKKEELKMVEQANSEKMTQVNNRVHELLDEIKQMEHEIGETKKEIAGLDDKIEKTMVSSNDLIQSEEQLTRELTELQADEARLKEKLKATNDANLDVDLQFQKLQKDIRSLTHQNSEAQEKLRSIQERRTATEQKIREMLKPYESDPNIPLTALIKKLLMRKRQKV
jgi:chromosome segregation ATPase